MSTERSNGKAPKKNPKPSDFGKTGRTQGGYKDKPARDAERRVRYEEAQAILAKTKSDQQSDKEKPVKARKARQSASQQRRAAEAARKIAGA